MCATRSESPIPSKLDELEMGGQLGRGVTSSVKLAASRTGTNQLFAIKVIEKARIAGQKQLERLFLEKELLGELLDPAIVGFFGTLKDETHLYFILEFLDGGELLWHMRRCTHSRVPVESARLCMAALLLPLRFMQERGVLYRDIKPTNIMFTRLGKLKLVDFGHAKRMGPSERSSSVCGTPHFHAPEVVRGEGHGLPAQLWALGVLLLEMVSGAPPFAEGRGSISLKEQILTAALDMSCLPEAAVAFAEALLTRDPERREALFPGGFGAVIAHPWLAELDWAAVESARSVPTFDFAAYAEQAEDLMPLRASKPQPPDLFASFDL